jgi:DNA-directed RNA polymerase specialized sigma24 family protein
VIKINDYLRREVKLLHALQDIRYKEIAEYLEIKQDSFWSWLHCYYDFGREKQ